MDRRERVGDDIVIELDRGADISPYTEPERYAAVIARARRDFARLDRALARLRRESSLARRTANR